MTLIAFTPTLGISKQITAYIIGEVDHALVWVAILAALIGTVMLITAGIKLPALNTTFKKRKPHIEKNCFRRR